MNHGSPKSHQVRQEPAGREGRCAAALQRGRYTALCSRKAKRNGFCAFHDNRPELRAQKDQP